MACVAFGVFLIACRPRTTLAPPQAGEFAFSLATYNINFGTGHRAETIDAIAELDADVVFLQETTPDSEAVLRSAFEDEYQEIRFHHCCRAGGLGILSRLPVLDDELLEARGGFFPAWWARFDTPRGAFVGPQRASASADQRRWELGLGLLHDPRRSGQRDGIALDAAAKGGSDRRRRGLQ